MSPWVRKATIAVEDHRFFEHDGVDIEGIARAAVADVKAGRIVEGGSTITQQLVRNLYISRERTVQRKLKEACLATKLDRAWTKHRILTTYLNQVYYGSQAYGIEAASQTFFSKPAAGADAVRVGAARRVDAGAIDLQPVHRARREPKRVAQPSSVRCSRRVSSPSADIREPSSPISRFAPAGSTAQIREPYFFGYVRDRLIEVYGAGTVRSGGLRVYTTIKPRYQRLAEKAIRDTMTEPDDPAAALISISPRTGAIRAMAAIAPTSRRTSSTSSPRRDASPARRSRRSSSRRRSRWGSTRTRPTTSPHRSPTGCIRPATATTGAGGAFTPTRTTTTGGARSAAPRSARTTPCTHSSRSTSPPRRSRKPRDGWASARRSTSRARTCRRSGSARSPSLRSISRRRTRRWPPVASMRSRWRSGGSFSPSGKEDPDAGWGVPKRRRAISEGTAAIVTRILEQNMQSGTGTRAAFGRPAAGKTGTNEEHKDAWFAGYTPDLATTVWIGYTKGEIPMENVHGIAVSGGSFPAEIWRLFMEPALDGVEPRRFPEPTFWPEWQPFTRGQYALTYDPSYTPETEETETDGGRGDRLDRESASGLPRSPRPDAEPADARGGASRDPRRARSRSRPRPFPSSGLQAGSSPSRRSRASTSLRSRAPRWTASPCARRRHRRRCRSRSASPRAGLPPSRSRSAPPPRSRRAVRCQRARTRSCPWSRRSRRTARYGSPSRRGPRRTSVPAAATCVRARSSSRRAFGSGLRRSARLPRPASPKSSAHDVRASPSSPPAASCGRRATSSSRGRSTSRTAR